MGTSCTIAIQKADDSIKLVRCNWDGYLSGVGQELLDFYVEEEQIDELIALGELRSISGGGIDAYHRDQGEDYTEPSVYSNLNSYLKDGANESYNYIFRGEWYCVNDNNKLELLEELV